MIVKANSADPDESLHFAAFYFGFHRLRKVLIFGFVVYKELKNHISILYNWASTQENLSSGVRELISDFVIYLLPHPLFKEKRGDIVFDILSFHPSLHPSILPSLHPSFHSPSSSWYLVYATPPTVLLRFL